MTDAKRAYQAYLQTEHWAELRSSALERDRYKCVRCGRDWNLQVHHLQYRTPWESCVLEDVQTLCRKCHRKAHGLSTPKRHKHRKERRKAQKHVAMPNRGGIFDGFLSSQLWFEENHVLRVWLVLMLRKDRQNVVRDSVTNLAITARVSLDQCQNALKRLQSSEHKSRGIRRMENGHWIVGAAPPRN